jgi:hypothetical protein
LDKELLEVADTLAKGHDKPYALIRQGNYAKSGNPVGKTVTLEATYLD